MNMKTVVITVGLFFAGYYFGEQSAEKAEQDRINERKEVARAVATEVQNDITRWKKNVKTIEKIEPVYLNECVTDDYRRVFNDNQRLLSGKPVSKVSD